MIWNRMTPRHRRALAWATLFNLVVFGGLAVAGQWDWASVLILCGVEGLAVALWPSNKALAEAERMKELGDGDG